MVELEDDDGESVLTGTTSDGAGSAQHRCSVRKRATHTTKRAARAANHIPELGPSDLISMPTRTCEEAKSQTVRQLQDQQTMAEGRTLLPSHCQATKRNVDEGQREDRRPQARRTDVLEPAHPLRHQGSQTSYPSATSLPESGSRSKSVTST